MLRLYFESFRIGELSFAISDDQGNIVDRVVFTGDVKMPKTIDAALVVYLSKLLENKEDLKLIGPVSVGLVRGCKSWLKMRGIDDTCIYADLKLGSFNRGSTWLMNTNSINVKIKGSTNKYLETIAKGLLFSNKYKGILLNCTDISYELLSTKSFTIIADGTYCLKPLI